jgi:hypothetical protein
MAVPCMYSTAWCTRDTSDKITGYDKIIAATNTNDENKNVHWNISVTSENI